MCHILASVLKEAGYKVGLHTLSHYTDFRERIKVNGEMIPEKAVSRFVADNMAFFDEIEPSFFEMSVDQAMPAEQLQKIAKDCGLKGKIAGNVDEALKMTMEAAGDEDVVFVGGSSFLVGDVLRDHTYNN